MTAPRGRPELVEQLTEGIARLTTSEDWKRFLDVQSRFHRYSFANALLIGAQRPGATRVAGFHTWRRMGRSVRKGERALWILAPLVYRRSRDGDAGDGDGGGGGAGGGGGRPAGERVIRGFKWVPVFDADQTEGDELPAACHRLAGDDPGGLYAELEALAHSIGFSVESCALAGGVNGDCSHDLSRIRVEVANAPAQRAKTLAHEIAHALLHQSFDDRWLAELEAESTAYVVCAARGLDTGDYSFGYCASWAAGGERAVAAIRACGERIQRTAATILRAGAADGAVELAA